MGAIGQSILNDPAPSRSCSLSHTSWVPLVDGLLRSLRDWPPTSIASLCFTDLEAQSSCMSLVQISDAYQMLPRHETISLDLRSSEAPTLPSPVASRLSSLRFTDAVDLSVQMGYPQEASSRFSAFANHPLRTPSPVCLVVRLIVLDDRSPRDATPAVPLAAVLGHIEVVRCDRKRSNHVAQRLDATRDTSPPRETYVRRHLCRQGSHVKSVRPNNLWLYSSPRGRATPGFGWAMGSRDKVRRIDRRNRSDHNDPWLLRNHTRERPARSSRPLCLREHREASI